MKISNLTKKEALDALKSGNKIYLDQDNLYLHATGIDCSVIYDQTGFNFTNWFHLYGPEKGWNIKIN